MKWCGKSAPRPRRRGRHGKPHPEKVQIDVLALRSSLRGAKEGPTCPVERLLTEPGRMGRTFEAARERGPRQMTVAFRKGGTRPGLHGPRDDISQTKVRAIA